jgi:mannosyltransferase OCH1-like enzyme
MVTRSQQYACNRLNGTILVQRSWTQKAEKTYDRQTKTRDPHGDLAPERIRNAFHRIIWQVYGNPSPLPAASRSS